MICISQISPVYAHPIIVDSDPNQFQTIKEPPNRVVIIFSEPIELDYSKISVINANGKEVKVGNQFNLDGDKSTIGTMLQSDLSDGTYIVSSKVLSAVDGHVVDSSFTFNIGEENNFSAKEETKKGILDLLSINDSFARLPGYFGQILFFGIIFLNLFIWKPFSRIANISLEFMKRFRIDIENKSVKLAIISLLLVLLSSILMIVVQSHVLNANILDILMTKFGNIMIIRLILVSILLSLLIIIFIKTSKNNSDLMIKNKLTFIFILFGLLLFLSNSFISHASATNKIIAVGLDFFHQIAASIWIGGILFLTIVIVPQIKKIPQNLEKSVLTAVLISRYSAVVIIVLGSICITGPILLWFIENNLSYISSSLYGIILSLKILLALVMIALGGYHSFVTLKKFDSSLGIGKSKSVKINPDGYFHIKSFSNNLKIESLVGIALIFSVSLLTNMVLPASENISFAYYDDEYLFFKDQFNSDSEFIKSTDTELYDEKYNNLKLWTYSTTDSNKKIELEIPSVFGENKFKLSFVKEKGNFDENIVNSTIKITNIEKNIGPIKIDANKISDGVFVGKMPLNIPGIWNLEIQGITSEQNESNYIGVFQINIKPNLDEFKFEINEYKTQNSSLLLNLVFDKKTNSIWSGDTSPNSGQILQFKIEDKKYINHKINNTNLISIVKIDPKNSEILWYLDPVGKFIGIYDIKNYREIIQKKVPSNGTISGLEIDGQQNVWLTTIQDNNIIKFDPKTDVYKIYKIPTENSKPMSIKYDSVRDLLWFVEAEGKIAKIDPKDGKVTEYPDNKNGKIKLQEPTELFIDQKRGEIFISDHKTNQIITFNPFLEMFTQVYELDENGLAFGMTQDDYGNLWVAQHTSEFLIVLDPETKEKKKIDIPTQGSFVQHLTSDNTGKIWFAEQRGNGVGTVFMNTNPSNVNQNSVDNKSDEITETFQNRENILMNFLYMIGLRFIELIGIFIISGTFVSTILFIKNQIDFENKIRLIGKLDDSS